MTIDQFIKLLEAFAKLLGVLVWPIIVLIVIWRLLPSALALIPNLESFSFDAFGVKASIERRKAAASEALTAAATKPGDQDGTIEQRVTSAQRVVAYGVTSNAVKKLIGKRVLWVDDRPGNNRRERQAFEAVGIRFEIALDTDEALSLLTEQHFDLVISDMGRPSDPRAGYTLLEQIRNRGNMIPFVIYAGSAATEHRNEAKRRGALDSTNRADELFTIVTNALQADG